jgi:hypothetical protein
MRQFDICRLKQRDRQLVVILQHDTIDELESRVVAPLSDVPYRSLIARLRIPMKFEGAAYVVQLDRMAAIDRREIGDVLGNAIELEQNIKNGIDLPLFGA